jgi:hypothetical protein
MKTLYLLLFFVISCSDNTGYSLANNPTNEEEPRVPIERFSTRLNNNLLIAGIRCNGGEQTDNEGQTYTCLAGDYLITVDNINYCTPEGCTDVNVIPVIASLIGTGGDAVTAFYDIRPVNEVSSAQAAILEDVQVRSRNDEDIVLFK